MPLDPLSALSVAACAVQFVDFASKIVSKAKNIHRSADGALRENSETETITIRLQEMAKELESSELSSATHNLDDNERRLGEICNECSQITKQLVKRLGDLKVPRETQNRKWKSFRQALKSVWSKREVDEMAAKLVGLRSELDTNILVSLRSKINATELDQTKILQKLESSHAAIIKAILTASLEQSEELQTQLKAQNEWQEKEFAKHRAAFVSEDGAKRRRRVELDILQSLRFPTINDRYESIATAYDNTFLWVYENPQEFDKPWSNFGEWLSSGSNIYWIQGKAASGKSTLMRFIWNNPSTLIYLKNWSRGSKTVVAAFFFWNSGIQEQRSQIGLLRSLLYVALKDRRSLIPDVFPDEWENKCALAAHDLPISPEIWSLGRLKRGFRDLTGLASRQLKLCFFIDGLDEYEGEAEEIAQYFKELSLLSNHAKFCLSSRPWPIFHSIFEGCRGLRLQDLTRNDIKIYVHEKLEKDNHMQELLEEDSANAFSLIEEIVQKCAGVFLWVVLVVKSLVSGLRNGDGIPHLRRRLAALPADLEKLYEHMINTIDPLDLEEASKIFQIFRASGYSLHISTLEASMRFSDYHEAMRSKTIRGGASVEMSRMTVTRWNRMITRLNSRCKGLLETVGNDYDVDEEEIEFPSGSAPPPDSQSKDVFQTKISTDDQVILISDTKDSSNNQLKKMDVLDSPITEASEIDPNRQLSFVETPKSARAVKESTLQPNKVAAREAAQPTDIVLDRYDREDFETSTMQQTKQPLIVKKRRRPRGKGRKKVDNSENITTTHKPADRPSSRIVYLHRTVRDYLEQPHVWKNLINQTDHSGYDPTEALLMAYVIEAKAIDIMLRLPTFYEGGIFLFAEAVKTVRSPASKAHIDLFEELDRVLSFVWAGKSHAGSKGHWSNSAPVDSDPPSDSNLILSEKEGLNILTLSIEYGAVWYLDSGLPSMVYTASKQTRQLLLTFSLAFHEFQSISTSLTSELPSPKLRLLESVLSTGISPHTVLYENASAWQWAVHFFHATKQQKIEEKASLEFVKAFKLMLDHGANTEKFCQCGSFWRDVLEEPIKKIVFVSADSEAILSMIKAEREKWKKMEEERTMAQMWERYRRWRTTGNSSNTRADSAISGKTIRASNTMSNFAANIASAPATNDPNAAAFLLHQNLNYAEGSS